MAFIIMAFIIVPKDDCLAWYKSVDQEKASVVVFHNQQVSVQQLPVASGSNDAHSEEHSFLMY
jgi:hypothetical protein